MKINETQNIEINGESLKIAIILPYFNDSLGKQLLENTKNELTKNNVKEENISVTRTAGALETPLACKRIIKKSSPDAIIALGIIIRGDTPHFDLVAKTTYDGLMKVQLGNNTPIIFGILTCENIEQAEERVDEKRLNKGKEAAIAALIQTQI